MTFWLSFQCAQHPSVWSDGGDHLEAVLPSYWFNHHFFTLQIKTTSSLGTNLCVPERCLKHIFQISTCTEPWYPHVCFMNHYRRYSEIICFMLHTRTTYLLYTYVYILVDIFNVIQYMSRK